MQAKIITIKGGLGNQLFQYAYGLKLSLIDKKKVIFDTSFFADTRSDIHRPFLLNKFNIDPSFQFAQMRTSLVSQIIKKAVQKITGNYEYFQSEKYFIEVKDEVLRQYTLKSPLGPKAEEIQSKIGINSVSLHIRRGDYVNNTHHGLADLGYYYKAMHHIKSKMEAPVFFIFSDDIGWVKKNLQIGEAVFVSDGSMSEVEELILISKCSHNIIANSTFSWWGAYLNPNPKKIVIAPSQWTLGKTAGQLDILPKAWIQL
jgi:hypothetical protein